MASLTPEEYQQQIGAVREDLRAAKEEAQREGVDAVGYYQPTLDPNRAETLRAEVDRLADEERELVAQ
jgi:outer membrane murein-binding lipoprotein Lpp